MNTINAQIEAVLPHADMTLRAMSLLQNFFLERTTPEEEDELAEWKKATPANSSVFDLLIELNEYGPDSSIAAILKKHTKKLKMNRVKAIVFYSAAAVTLLALVDSTLQTGVLNWMIYGTKPGRPVTEINVTAGVSPKTFWLPDSTRVELYPNSTLVYPNRFIWSKKVQLKGSARFDIRSTVEGSLHVILGKKRSVEQEFGPLIVITDSTGKMVVQGVPH